MKFSQIFAPTHAPAPVPLRAALAPKRPKPKEIYAGLVAQAKALVLGLSSKTPRPPDLGALAKAVSEAAEVLEQGRSRLLAYVERSTPEDYLPGHLANVSILSLAVGKKLGFSEEVQWGVGIAAFLHHAGQSLDRSVLGSLNSQAGAAVERTLWPPKGSDRPTETQLIDVCHDYEEQSHPRPGTPRRLSHDVLRSLIEQAGDVYDGNILKKLWEAVSLFPPGSYVKLSTGEIAKVVEIHDERPIKPIVQVLIGPAGERIGADKLVDLSQAGSVTIESAVDECTVKVQDPVLHLELKAQRWWME